MLINRPCSSVRMLLWFLCFGYFGLTILSYEVRAASNQSVLPIGQGSVVPCHKSVTSFGQLNCKYVCTLLLWSLLPLVLCKCLQVFSLSVQDVEFSADF
jgi:hypothetical protein